MEPWATNLQQNSFNGIDNIAIAYGILRQPQQSPAMVIVNGRSESFLKYQELANDCYRQGYSVYLLDHRGQGLSGRLNDDHQIGYVDDFNNYVKDLATFINDIVLSAGHQRHVIVGHSMGGAIVARYLQNHDNPIDRAVMASPMLGMLMPLPQPVVKLISHAWSAVDQLFERRPSYVMGTGVYENKPFEGNDLTQSATRYHRFRAIFEEFPQIKIGGPTYPWLLQAMNACRVIVSEAHKLKTTTLLLQSGADTIVSNEAQLAFCRGAQKGMVTRVMIEDARHELFFELDCYREKTLQTIFEFLES